MQIPRVLFYAVNGLGLGHVTRLLAIARRVRHHCPNAEIVFLTSSEAEDVIYREGFAAFKVPSRTLRAQTHLRAATYARMLQTVSLNLLSAFHPHILVVDTFPAGTMQELLPVLRWDSRKVFVFRAQRPHAAQSPQMQNALRLYDLAIIPHAEGEAGVALPEGMARVWTGPILIRDRTETKSRAEARELLGLPAEGPVLYITFGGGGDIQMDTALSTAVETLAHLPDCHLAIASAPLHRRVFAPRPHVHWIRHYPMAELYPAFDAALTAAGYNTAMELLHHGVPAAFVPFARQVDDQEARALHIAQTGAGIALTGLDPALLPQTVARLLDPVESARFRETAMRLVPDSGADRAALALLELLH